MPSAKPKEEQRPEMERFQREEWICEGNPKGWHPVLYQFFLHCGRLGRNTGRISKQKLSIIRKRASKKMWETRRRRYGFIGRKKYWTKLHEKSERAVYDRMMAENPDHDGEDPHPPNGAGGHGV